LKVWKKIVLSIAIQGVLFFGIPKVVSRLPFMGTKWVNSWESIKEHEIFRDKSPQKIVLLGASYWGERLCMDEPNVPNSFQDETCMTSLVLNIEKHKLKKMEDFNFFQTTQGGSGAQAHLYFLLNLLEINDGSLKYIAYDGPRLFELDLHERENFSLHKKLLEKINMLPVKFQSEKLSRFAKKLDVQIRKDIESGESFAKPDIVYELRKIIHQNIRWFGKFQSRFKSYISKDSDEKAFTDFLARHNQLNKNKDKNEFFKPLFPLVPKYYMTRPENLEFLDLLYELCEKAKIKLVITFPPDQRLFNTLTREPWESKIFQPTNSFFSNKKGVYILDYRDMPASVPRDSIDGLHPSLSGKLTLAKKLLTDLEKINEATN
jgi:hypothetical protein